MFLPCGPVLAALVLVSAAAIADPLREPMVAEPLQAASSTTRSTTVRITSRITGSKTGSKTTAGLTEHEAARRLTAAYPGAFRVQGDTFLVWPDGTKMPIAEPAEPARPPQTPADKTPRGWPLLPLKELAAGRQTAARRDAADQAAPGQFSDDDGTSWLTSRDLRAIFQDPYERQDDLSTPPQGDPGRARPERFFTKLYGDCRAAGGRPADIVGVPWLAGRFGRAYRIFVTTRQGVARRLLAVSEALEKLPRRFDRYLRPPGGGFNCRTVAGTGRLSAHGYGIAIDIAVQPADYWRWTRPDAHGHRRYRNRIPLEIVKVFEEHGFIWGGRWRHFDTMHFEYRPELLPPRAPLPGATAGQ